MNPLIPMLAITGNPTNEQLEKMLTAYKAVGIDAVMLYPRSGLEVEYMSDAWRELVGFVLETAENLDMHIWLYDEFNWPSGSCKNTVIEQDPAFGAKRFLYENGEVRVEVMRPGEVQRVAQPFDSDMLNPAAVRCFIKLTHEKYYAWFGKYFGNVIAGIFTDEPSFIYTANGKGMYPYYDGVCEDYFAACGGDLKADIRAHCEGEITPNFPGVFRSLIGKRFKESFIDQVAAWCKAHNLPLTGHTLDDENPLSATRETGDWFPFIEQMDIPGVDEIPTRLSVYDEMLFSMMENVRYNGKPHAMAELFALGPCSMPYARRRQLLWYAAAHGIDHFFIAISHLDAKGNVRKPDFFDNFNYHNPDFEGVRLLAQAAEKAAAFAQKRPTATVGIRVPYTLYLAALGKGEDTAVADTFKAIIEDLVASQVTFRFLRETETADTPFVLTMKEDGILEETENRTYQTVADAVTAIAAKDNGVKVVDKNGALVKNIRVKTYEDGSVIILDRENAPVGARACTLHTQNGQVDFTLENYGVKVFEKGVSEAEKAISGEEISLINVTVTPLCDNVLRPQFFGSDTFRFTLSEPLTVKVHRRVYPDASGAVTVDGNTVAFDRPCDALTDCFSYLYRTGEVQLSAGEHTVFTDMKDYGYLPAVLFTGAFPFDNTFFGKLEVTGELAVPADAKAAYITMDDHLLYVTAKIDGETVGEDIFAPYRFEIPPKYFGKTVTVTLTFHTSLAPLFGDLCTWNKQGVFTTAWEDTPKSAAEMLHIDGLNLRSVIQ